MDFLPSSEYFARLFRSADWPDVNLGTTTSGIVGGVLTLMVVFIAGRLLRRTHRSASPPSR